MHLRPPSTPHSPLLRSLQDKTCIRSQRNHNNDDSILDLQISNTALDLYRQRLQLHTCILPGCYNGVAILVPTSRTRARLHHTDHNGRRLCWDTFAFSMWGVRTRVHGEIMERLDVYTLGASIARGPAHLTSALGKTSTSPETSIVGSLSSIDSVFL